MGINFRSVVHKKTNVRKSLGILMVVMSIAGMVAALSGQLWVFLIAFLHRPDAEKLQTIDALELPVTQGTVNRMSRVLLVRTAGHL